MKAENVVGEAKRLIGHNEFAKARDMLEPWLETHPDDGSAWSALGAAEFSLGNLEKARGATEKATLLRPDNALDWCNLGTTLRKSGLYEQAETAQRCALELDPDCRRARVELQKNERDRATKPARPAPERPPAEPRQPAATSGGGPSERWAWIAERGWAIALGLALLICLVWVLVGGHIARQREAAAMAEAAARARTLEQQARAAEPERRRREAALIGRQMARNTIAYVDSLQSPDRGGESRTDAQREASWVSEFKGQWVRWEGTVVDVKRRGETWAVSLRCSPAIEASDTRFDLDTTTALGLKKGQRIRIEGRLDEQHSSRYDLVDVRVVAKW